MLNALTISFKHIIYVSSTVSVSVVKLCSHLEVFSVVMNSQLCFLKSWCCWQAQSIICSYRVCGLRAPCRLMLMGMLNDLRGEPALRIMPSPIPAISQNGYSANKLDSIWKSDVLQPNDHLISVTSSSAVLQTAVYPPGNFLLFTRSSKVSATTSSTLLCVSIETTAGKAGSRLMASRLACDSQLEPIVVKRLSFSL